VLSVPFLPSLPPMTTTTAAPRTTVAPTTTTAAPAPAPAVANGPLALAGCPPPPHPPTGPPGPPPWHPAVLVPESQLPPETAPAPWTSNVTAIRGKGMWVWMFNRTEHGNVAAIIQRAAAAGLTQLWVRIGDSQSGFYGAAELAALVPAAHRAGIAVIGWGFPYLYDPMGDASWTAQALAWTGPGGARIDGFSADIERSTEGVALDERRAAAYLGAVRRSAGSRLIIATVYPPLDIYWTGDYPYTAIARYVDAFAPMVYWECTDPAADVRAAYARLATLRPVHVIGQAFSLADVGGRIPNPSAAEIDRFLAAGRQVGALGASFWVWQSATAEEWAALGTYRWTG
jgi:hypothetical protein